MNKFIIAWTELSLSRVINIQQTKNAIGPAQIHDGVVYKLLSK
jgi:hypothetical protein